GFALGVGVEMIDETLHSLMNPAMKMMSRSINRRAKETWLTSEQANRLFSRGRIDEQYWTAIVESEGYEDIIARQLYEASMPYPSIPDFILYARYHGNPDITKAFVNDWFDVPDKDYTVWEFLAAQRLTSIQVQTLFRMGLIDEQSLIKQLSEIGWNKTDRLLVKELSWMIPNAMLLVQGNLLQEKSTDDIITDISIAQINPKYARTYLDAVLTKPATQDIIAYELRQDPELSNLESELRRIGIHDKYFKVYKELAYQIPPIADIITMAVREAFSPGIAAKFGQYEDFPEPLEMWAGKKGLSPEWAKRYWAAHWSLPSPLQGFEMLHRGVINEPELNMLLRALDIMPFWREKLTKIAYRRLTRVDIRRMYKQGVLTEKEIYESYKEHGYSDENATRMTEFTVKQTLATLSKFSSGDIINAFTKRMISKNEAISLLSTIGIRRTDAGYIVSTAEYKRKWALTEQQISGIRNLYKKRVYNENETRDKLSRLNLPTEQLNVLMEQWYYEKIDELDSTWTTAQTISMLRKGIISTKRAKRELNLNGYDDEHITAYLGTITFSRITEERLKRLKEGIKESQQSRQTQTEQQLRQY
ncbi:hypothetical protein LCGC14_1965420, partial [marine sediment metagenome]